MSSLDHSGLTASIPSAQEEKTASVADILEQAAALIEPEGAWTQGAFARTAKGRVIGSIEAPATCFCAVGAIYRVAHPHGSYKANRAIDLLAQEVGQYHIGEWNDRPNRTQSQVVATLRLAAERAKSEAAS